MQRKHNKNIVPIAKTLRKNMTKEEKHLWYDFLRFHPARFSRQKVLGKYIADFYSAKAKLIIELDGSGHYTEEGKLYDEERTSFLE
jgi:very-short-patch-repair endonuclease